MSLLPVTEALERLLDEAARLPVTQTETLAAAKAQGRILAQPLIAGLTLPPWPNSAMDGYAVRSSDIQPDTVLPISQEIFAGKMPTALEPGTCARIFTGAPLPEGADAVEMQEKVERLDDGQARFAEGISPGHFVRPAGLEAQPGQLKLEAGSRLGPIELALAASLGIHEVQVFRPLRVAVLSTGDELVEPGQPLKPGQIYNSNRPLLLHWLERLGCETEDLGCLPDDPEQIRARLARLENIDLLLGSGGVSVGEADYLGQVLREDGEVNFWRLNLKPGKPTAFGNYQGIPFLGLPGNPVSTLVTFGLLARPYIQKRMGLARVLPQSFPVPIGFAIPDSGSRREFMRVGWRDGQVQRYDNQCSSLLSSAAWADGLLEVPENQSFAPGDMLNFFPFAELFN